MSSAVISLTLRVYRGRFLDVVCFFALMLYRLGLMSSNLSTMTPPPVHVQIEPHHARRQQRGKGKGNRGKGTFTRVSGSTSRKTSNYRIRTLADGRIGQQHITRTVPPAPMPADEMQPDHPNPPPSPSPPPPLPLNPDVPPPKKRAPQSNTWAVGLRSPT